MQNLNPQVTREELRSFQKLLGIDSFRKDFIQPGQLRTKILEEEKLRQCESLFTTFNDFLWQLYEGYMKAQHIFTKEGEAGMIGLYFPPNLVELPLHRHDYSDRTILIRKGSGIFLHKNLEEQIIQTPVTPGSLLEFPCRTVHTFHAGLEGLTTYSVHYPFIPFASPNVITYL